MVLLLCVATMFIAIVFGENVRFSGTGDTVIVPEYGLAMKRSGYNRLEIFASKTIGHN